MDVSLTKSLLAFIWSVFVRYKCFSNLLFYAALYWELLSWLHSSVCQNSVKLETVLYAEPDIFWIWPVVLVGISKYFGILFPELRNGWLIHTATKSFAVYAATASEKTEWMCHMEHCIKDLLRKSNSYFKNLIDNLPSVKTSLKLP